MAHLRASTNASTIARTSLETVDFTHLIGRGKSGAVTDVNTMRRDDIRRVVGFDESEVRFSLHGDFDISNKPELSETLAPYMASRKLTVDLSHVTFIDASTLSVFVNIARCRRELHATRLRIVNGSTHFRRVFSLCGLDDGFDLEDVAPRTAKPPSFVARSLAFVALP